MADLDPVRREELREAMFEETGDTGEQALADMDTYADAVTPLIARWLAEAKAEGAAEVRARVEAAVAMSDHEPTNRVWHEQMQRIRSALADPTEETP